MYLHLAVIHLHEIVKIVNISRRARGPDGNPLRAGSGRTLGNAVLQYYEYLTKCDKPHLIRKRAKYRH